MSPRRIISKVSSGFSSKTSWFTQRSPNQSVFPCYQYLEIYVSFSCVVLFFFCYKRGVIICNASHSQISIPSLVSTKKVQLTGLGSLINKHSTGSPCEALEIPILFPFCPFCPSSNPAHECGSGVQSGGSTPDESERTFARYHHCGVGFYFRLAVNYWSGNSLALLLHRT